MRLVSSDQMGVLDRRTIDEFGIAGIVLMESAGGSAWRTFRDACLSGGGPRRIVFAAGTGNNGGDALVMARLCHEDGYHQPVVLLARAQSKGDAEVQRRTVAALGLPTEVWETDSAAAARAIDTAHWVVDGISGTGIKGALRAPHSEIVERINASSARVVSVDAPSGIGDGTEPSALAVRADLTLTLALPKRCLYQPANRPKCGNITVVPFTLPTVLHDAEGLADELLEPEDLESLLPPVERDAHKGRRGRVAVYAGAPGTIGAAALASRGALAAGAGLVTVHADESVSQALASGLVSVMVRSLSGTDTTAVDAVVVGPGWGRAASRPDLLRAVCERYERGVIDADGLNVLSETKDVKLTPEWVLTPHPAEMARLLSTDTAEVTADLYAASVKAARRYNAVVVAKACTTWIAHPDGMVAVVDGMTPELATAGSGDVLAGITGAMLASGAGAWRAARAAALLHMAAGKELAAEAGMFLSADLPRAVSRLAGGRVVGAPGVGRRLHGGA